MHCTDAAGESQRSSRAAADTDHQLQKIPKLFSDTSSIFPLAFKLTNKHKTDNFDNTYRLLAFGIHFEFSAKQLRSRVVCYHYMLHKYLLKYLNTVHNSIWATCYKNKTMPRLKPKNNVKENDSKH